MASVLSGIAGLILFIAIGLVGAIFFGEVANESIVEARAQSVIQSLNSVANAVIAHDRELETLTAAGADPASLVPSYLAEAPVNPLNGTPIRLATRAAGLSSGGAEVAVALLDDDPRMCRYFDRLGGGNGETIPAFSGQFTSSIAGCVKMPAGSPLASGDGYTAYVRIR